MIGDRESREDARRRARAAGARARAEARDHEAPTEDDWTLDDPDDPVLRRIGAPTTVADALASFVRRRGWTERLGAADVLARWDEIVGPELARACEPVRLAGGVLVVRAADQAWATQLTYLLDRVRDRVNDRLGRHEVRIVRVTVGPLERRSGDRAPGDPS